MKLDSIDRSLLRALQRDARRPVADLAEEVGLSPSTCHRRIKLLEEAGLISAYVARLHPGKLGYTLEFFVEVSLNTQADKVLSSFEAAVARAEEILECHLMAGGTDYVLRVVAADVADFERIHRTILSKLPHVARLQSNLAIRTVRRMTGYPVP